MSSPPPTSPPPVLANPLASPPEIGLRPTLPDPSCTHCSGYLPSLPHAASIAFRHPGYDDQSNLLFRLQAFDSADSLTWGLHHHTALTACSIIACNVEGFLSPTRLGSSTPPILPSLDSLLTSRVYYFYPSTVSGGIELASVDLRYPICPDFIHWQFPHNDFPKEWLEIDVSKDNSPHQSPLFRADLCSPNYCIPPFQLFPRRHNIRWPCRDAMNAAGSLATATVRRPHILSRRHNRNG